MRLEDMPGMLITLEGGEGAGKSTLMKALVAKCVGEQVPVIETREPGGTPLAEALRSLILNPPGGAPISPLAEALMLNAARLDHLEKKIRPALADGSWVISDRFSDSTLAYQGSIGGVPLSVLRSLEATVLGDIPEPVTLILDADPEALLERRKARGGATDAFEARPLSFHRSVRETFLKIAKERPERYVVLNALRTPPRLLEDAWTAILAAKAAKARDA